jgi:hypothetical protein
MRPDPRPELRKWLAAPESWDELVFWCIGRFVHKPGDLADMIKWAQVHGKNLGRSRRTPTWQPRPRRAELRLVVWQLCGPRLADLAIRACTHSSEHRQALRAAINVSQCGRPAA